jgi:hypothetical protein
VLNCSEEEDLPTLAYEEEIVNNKEPIKEDEDDLLPTLAYDLPK